MKTALCIAGQPRTMEFCFPSLKKNIIDVYHPDIFVCSDSQGDRIKELYNPVDMEIYTQDAIWWFIDDRRTNYNNRIMNAQPENDLSVMWKSMQCGKMLKEYEREHGIYDIVLLTRFDVKFLHVQSIRMPEERALYVPQKDAFQFDTGNTNGVHFGGYSSQLCWFTSRTAEILLDIYNISDQLYKELGFWHSETMLKYLCDKEAINVKFVDIDMMIIRGTNENPLGCWGEPLSKYPKYMEAEN